MTTSRSGSHNAAMAAATKPKNIPAATFVLGACARTGDPRSDTDWWVEQHVWCDGKVVLAPGVMVRCSCPCHTNSSSPEAHARVAGTELARTRLGEATWDARRASEALHEPG